MKYKIEIAPDQTEDLVIYAKEDSETLGRIKAMLSELDASVYGYGSDTAVKLVAEDVYCFFTEGSRIYAECDGGRLLVKERLYQIEEIFSDSFVKINQSCLVNVSKIKKFESSIGGSLKVILKNGYKDYISRRQLKAVKRRLGI